MRYAATPCKTPKIRLKIRRPLSGRGGSSPPPGTKLLLQNHLHLTWAARAFHFQCLRSSTLGRGFFFQKSHIFDRAVHIRSENALADDSLFVCRSSVFLSYGPDPSPEKRTRGGRLKGEFGGIEFYLANFPMQCFGISQRVEDGG
jgi:hypothetical protein